MILINPAIAENLFDTLPIANVDSDIFALPVRSNQITWQTVFDSAPSAVNITISTSNDGTNFSVVDTSTVTAGEVRTFQTAAPFVKATINSHTGGSHVTVSLISKPGILTRFTLPILNSLGNLVISEDVNNNALVTGYDGSGNAVDTIGFGSDGHLAIIGYNNSAISYNASPSYSLDTWGNPVINGLSANATLVSSLSISQDNATEGHFLLSTAFIIGSNDFQSLPFSISSEAGLYLLSVNSGTTGISLSTVNNSFNGNFLEFFGAKGTTTAPSDLSAFNSVGSINWNPWNSLAGVFLEAVELVVYPTGAPDSPSHIPMEMDLNFCNALAMLWDETGFYCTGSGPGVGTKNLGNATSPWALVNANQFSVAGSDGIDASITTAGLVGKTITVSKGIITGFA